jgi:hypothetical protein
VLHAVLHQRGMHVRHLAFTECHPAAFLLAATLPLVAPATALEARHAIKRSRAGGRDLLRWMLDWRMLFSDQLMVVAQKESTPPESSAP